MNELQLVSAVVHRVGNKADGDGVFLSERPLELDETLRTVLGEYFTASFKSEEFFTFFHEDGLEANPVFAAATAIFDDPDQLYAKSRELAGFLYEKSEHPNIKNGEFYTVFFEGSLGGESTQVLGLFKSETKDTFLKVNPSMDGLELRCEQGVSVKKIDKGCLVFNRNREDGYALSIVDNSNRSEAVFWIDDFLHARQRRDSYSNTQDVLTMCKNYVVKELPKQFEVTKADQADFLNKSVEFFRQNERFNMQQFADEVIQQRDIIESFDEYSTNFQKDRGIDIDDNFAISESAFKKQQRGLKSVIKLDKNFHIYVHGNRNLIEQGEDAKGKFYKVYYQEES